MVTLSDFMFLGVQFMCLTPSFKMGRKSLSGNPNHVEDSSMVSHLLTLPLLDSYIISGQTQSLRNSTTLQTNNLIQSWEVFNNELQKILLVTNSNCSYREDRIQEIMRML